MSFLQLITLASSIFRMQLIVNADDFGLTRGVNLGIIEAFQQGVVRSTTLMVGMAAQSHAVDLAKENPDLKVGIHLRLTTGKPMADNVKSLQNSKGDMQNLSQFMDNPNMCPQEVERELRTQIEHFLSLGIPLSHIDGHHHCHHHPLVAPIVDQLSDEYQVPVRPTNETVEYNGNSLAFSDQFYGDDLSVDHFLDVIKAYVGHAQVLELMAHPALLDEPLLSASSYTINRTRELAILTTPSLPAMLGELGVTISDYDCLKD